MALTQKGKINKFVDEVNFKFKQKYWNSDLYCEKCKKHYKGSEIWLKPSYGTSGSKANVSINYTCKQGHSLHEINSKDIPETIFDYMIYLFIIAIIILVIIVIMKIGTVDPSTAGYR